MTDLKTVNGIEYTLDLVNMVILWKERELNHMIRIGSFTVNTFINRGIAEYRGERNNLDLLVASGKTQQEAQEILEVVNLPEMGGKVQFVPSTPGVAQLTENDKKRFMALVTEKHLNFISYESDGQDPENWVFVP